MAQDMPLLANIWELLSDKARGRKDLQPQESTSFKEAIKWLSVPGSERKDPPAATVVTEEHENLGSWVQSLLHAWEKPNRTLQKGEKKR